MKRKYHHYETWEDYQNGMYNSVTGHERKIMLNKAITFTGNADLYGEWMIKVINEWSVSCEQNLSGNDLNKQAWVGHAAVCMALGIPEDITREAWGCLSQQQQNEANQVADIAIKAWHEKQNNQIHPKVGTARLSKRHTRPSASEAGTIRQGAKLSPDMPSYTQE